MAISVAGQDRQPLMKLPTVPDTLKRQASKSAEALRKKAGKDVADEDVLEAGF